MAPVLAFWAVCAAAGLIALPISAALLKRFPDAGAGLCFVVGVLFSSYLYFMLRVARVLPEGRGGFVLAIILLAVISAAVAGYNRDALRRLEQARGRIFIAFVIFTVAFVAYAAFRSYSPAIAGTEQPMDLMYVNAAANSPDYPPHDSWLAGERASYYYFGYVQVGLLMRVSGVSAGEGYNLGLAYVFAAAAAAAVSLAGALLRWTIGRRLQRQLVWAGGISLLLLLFVGSVSAVFELLAAHGNTNEGLFKLFGVEWMIPCKPGVLENCYTGTVSPRTSEWYPTEFWFWWRGSRIIPQTITEFPFFSFLLGDLHPHVMSLPVVALAMSISAQMWRSRGVLTIRTHTRPLAGVVFGVILGALAFQNAWDLIPFTVLFALAILIRNLRSAPPRQAILGAAGYLVPVLAVAVIAYLPWYLDFTSQASGLEPYVGAGTRPEHAFLQFGPLLFFPVAGLFLAFRGIRFDRLQTVVIWTGWLPLVPFLGWLALASMKGVLTDGVDARGPGGWVTLIVYGVLVWALAAAFILNALKRDPLAAPLAVCGLAVLLLYGAELFLIRDVFFTSVPRLNTVFKLSYQAWAMLSIAGPVLFLRAFADMRSGSVGRASLVTAAVLLLELGVVYPITAAFNRSDGFSASNRTIDGLAYVAQSGDSYEYDLVNWISTNIPADATVIEATGRTWGVDGKTGEQVVVKNETDYTDAGRLAARTGRSTPLGWFFHEIQWRGEASKTQAMLTRRSDLVDKVYRSNDASELAAALSELKAKYVVISGLERQRYGATLGAAVPKALVEVAKVGGATIYRVPVFETVPTS